MTREELWNLLRTGRVKRDKSEKDKTVSQMIRGMEEDELKEAVLDYVYSRPIMYEGDEADKEKKVYLIEYTCNDDVKRRAVIIAYNLLDAEEVFFMHWRSDYELGDIPVMPEDLKEIKISEWCSYWDLHGRF